MLPDNYMYFVIEPDEPANLAPSLNQSGWCTILMLPSSSPLTAFDQYRGLSSSELQHHTQSCFPTSETFQISRRRTAAHQSLTSPDLDFTRSLTPGNAPDPRQRQHVIDPQWTVCWHGTTSTGL